MEHKYKFNNRAKRDCPYCASKKSFSPLKGYEADTRYDEFGICDKKNSCEAGAGKFPPQDFNADTFEPQACKPKAEPLPKLELTTIFLDDEKVRYYLSVQASNLHTYALAIGISKDHLFNWGLGTDSHENTVFLFRDIKGQWCNLKRGKYETTGKRAKGEKDKGFYSLPQPYEKGENAKPERYALPLYGEHLLSTDKKKTVMIVESEKTALFASFFYPDYNWVACGSANGLSDGANGTNDKITPLKGRQVVWLCDADPAGRKASSIDKLKKYGIAHTVVDLFPKYGLKDDCPHKGWDLADELCANRQPDLEVALHRAKKEKDFEFWYMDSKGNLLINQDKLVKFLAHKGFSSLREENGEVLTLLRKDNILKQVDGYFVKQYFLDYIRTLPNPDKIASKEKLNEEGEFEEKVVKKSDDLVEILIKGGNVYFRKDKFEWLPPFDLPIMRDEARNSYFYFKNTAVQVERAGKAVKINILDYNELPSCLWEHHIKEYDFKPVSKAEWQKSDFFRFLSNVAGEENLTAFMQAIGYMLHTYKNPAYPVALVVGDDGLGEGSRGGRGKGIFFDAIAKMRKMATIDGKNIKHDNPHIYQRVTPDTNVVFFDDLRENFDFTNFFSLLTTGLAVNPKNTKEFYMPYKDSPKFGFTTNFVFSQEDASHQRRKLEILFKPYYSKDKTPADEFKHNLFDGWDEAEWNLFHNVMIACSAEYFASFDESEKPVIKPHNPDLSKKKLLAATRKYYNFVEWADGMLKVGEKFDKKLLMLDYIGEDDELKMIVKQATFTRFLEAYADFKNWKMHPDKSGSIYYVSFKEK